MLFRARSSWRLALRLLGLLLLLGLVAKLVDLGAVFALFTGIPLWVTAAGFALGLVRLLLMSLRWGILDTAGLSGGAEESAGGGSAPRLRARDYVRYQLANSSFNLVMPSVIGGDVARAFLVAAETSSHRLRRVLVILFDRLLGIFSVALLGTVAGIFAPGLQHRATYLGAVSILDAVLLGVLAVGVSRRLRRGLRSLLERGGERGAWLAGRVDELGSALESFRERPLAVLMALCVCFFVHGSTFALVVLGARALEIQVPVATLVLVTTMSWVIVLLPVSIGGLGLRELSFVALLGPQGVSDTQATALSFFQFAISALIGLAGIPVVLMGRRRAAPGEGSAPAPGMGSQAVQRGCEDG